MAKRKIAESKLNDVAATDYRRSSRLRTTAVESIASEKSRGLTVETLKTEDSLITDVKININENKSKTIDTTHPETNGDGSKGEYERQYWLMKAEPESRLEKGHDVKFSIDDLASKTKPEPWDGIRAYAARNNLRAMKKGDLAFFYHSSCKVPAIVGIMEIVREHSPDMTAQDPDAPYYDPKDSDSSNPKWSVVHVQFREKFKDPVTLHELKDMYASTKELANMQLLKQSRLSVSKVSKGEWDFLKSLIDKREANADKE